ncbi:plancitoxin-1-like protein [Leptotrombidium deliense]|uniref:Plancitoxin-1-like protein n=1 Tax=Leptotrombidium deliense TaxID=299467 RepID=A0A443RT83_9ACAR|nr:plancitoxin-1-like protein [Leptotrombidium deliense]
MFKQILIVILFSLLFQTAIALKCKNEQFTDVDWYYVYKIPKLEDKEEPFNTGYAYAFMTSEDYAKGWIMSNNLVTDDESIFAQTLQQLYSDENEQHSYVLYSDQLPDGSETSAYGHTKGVLAMDRTTDFLN